jgi:hypothetical protein
MHVPASIAEHRSSLGRDLLAHEIAKPICLLLHQQSAGVSRLVRRQYEDLVSSASFLRVCTNTIEHLLPLHGRELLQRRVNWQCGMGSLRPWIFWPASLRQLGFHLLHQALDT